MDSLPGENLLLSFTLKESMIFLMGIIQQDSFWKDETNPKHPNASWECILGMFFGSPNTEPQEVFNYLKIMISTFEILPFPVDFVSGTSGEPCSFKPGWCSFNQPKTLLPIVMVSRGKWCFRRCMFLHLRGSVSTMIMNKKSYTAPETLGVVEKWGFSFKIWLREPWRLTARSSLKKNGFQNDRFLAGSGHLKLGGV